MAGRGTDIILGGNFSQMAQLNLRSRLAGALLPIEEVGKVPDVDEAFYPCPLLSDLEQRLVSAVEAVAASPVGEATDSFLKLEELVATVAGEAPFAKDESEGALTQLRSAYADMKKT